jgi:tetratricopeptide (TPR) repeat protein
MLFGMEVVGHPEIFNSDSEQLDPVEVAKLYFYRCQFVALINYVNIQLKEQDSFSKFYQLVILKSKALYELNRRDLARESLKESLPESDSFKNTDYMYLKGSLHYFDGDFDLAKESFKRMMDTTHCKQTLFKSILALGNVAYSEKRKTEAFVYLNELSKLTSEMEVEKDIELSFDIFKGTVLLYNEIDVARSKELFEECFDKALTMNWTFFTQRSLYNLSKWFKMNGKKGESQGILKTLDMYLVHSDSRFLASLVNHEFMTTEHRSSQKIVLCENKKTVTIGNEDQYVLDLGRWPLLFTFLKVLSDNKGYVSKEKIAKELWPGQKYLPKTYDPRIYDIVARVKKRIELAPEVPLLIESGINGYKLNMA